MLLIRLDSTTFPGGIKLQHDEDCRDSKSVRYLWYMKCFVSAVGVKEEQREKIVDGPSHSS